MAKVAWPRWHQLNSARNSTRHCLIIFVDLEILHSWIHQTLQHKQTDQTRQTSQLLSSFFFATTTWFVSASQVSKVSTAKLRQLKIDVNKTANQPWKEHLAPQSK
jgi:hypothetical protein